MAYDPTVWKSGDTITSAKLNKLENGLAEASGGGTGGGVLVCTLPNQGSALDKTWKEIHDAFPSSVVVLISNGEGQSQMLLATSVGFGDELYYVSFVVFNDNGSSKKYYSVATENGYPVEETKEIS